TASGLVRLREVALALLDDDRLRLDEVAHAYLAGGDLRQRPVAAVVGQPGRAADGGRREAADRAEGAVAGAPQMLHRTRLRLTALRERSDLRMSGRLRAALELAADEIEVRECELALLRLGLDELEDALEEIGRVELPLAVVD